MRFPRNVKPLRGPADSAAVAGTLLLFWVITLLHSSLVTPAGIRLRLPQAPGFWGRSVPNLSVAVDAGGRISFENQIIGATNLAATLAERATRWAGEASLLLMIDRGAPAELITSLINTARTAGIREVVVAISPGPVFPQTDLPAIP